MKENEAKFKEENERYVQLKKEADESKKRFEACEKEKAKLKQETKHTKTRGKKVIYCSGKKNPLTCNKTIAKL